MHNRFTPVVHRFHYKLFMWWLDLDELEDVSQKNAFVSYNKFNLFSFYDRDHHKGETNTLTAKENVIAFLKENGHDWDGGKVYLLTNLRTLGYLFNPVSFYYFISADGTPKYAIAEVGNTYYEMKSYILPDFDGKMFELRIPKLFYVSPFTRLDDEFHFQLHVPGKKLNVRIDDFRDGERFFISTLTGDQSPLTSWSALKAFIRFPLVTLRVIILIHWQALKLWIKKVPYQAKADNKHLQKDVTRKHKSLR